MRYVIGLLGFALLTLWIIGDRAVPNSLQSSNPATLDYRTAYDRWCDAIDSNSRLGESLWLKIDVGPPELRSAVKDLLSFGPNLTDFLAQEMKTEQDELRLYRLVLLLNRVSGINLFFDSGEENLFEAAPRFRDQFVEAWDSGKFLNASERLQAAWKYGNDTARPRRIDPRRLTQLRRYGVFALPFIIENLEQRNSAELFAAFLIITGESDLYASYLEKPANLFTSRTDKLSHVRAWAEENADKIDKLESVSTRIRALTTK